MFPRSDFKLASLSKEELLRAAKLARPVLINSHPAHSDKETEDELLRLTLEEVEKGWISGPLTEKELDEQHGKLWTTARREET